MKRNDRSILTRIGEYCRGKDVLEIGCGDGSRMAEVAAESRSWTGIDPDAESVRLAVEEIALPNVEFLEGSADKLAWPESSFDVVVFTLSLHHMPLDMMPSAIDEAVRVVRPDGRVLFLEPMPEGSYFEAGRRFGCGGGDERRQLAYAVYVMMSSGRLSEIEEFTDRVSEEYDSFEDFLEHAAIRPGTESQLREYISDAGYTLDERFRLNVFRVDRGE